MSVPGVSEFVSLHSSAANALQQPWTRGLDPDDINLLHRKSFYSTSLNVALIEISTLRRIPETGNADRIFNNKGMRTMCFACRLMLE